MRRIQLYNPLSQPITIVVGAMLRENRLSLRNNRLKLEASRELPVISYLKEYIEEYTSNE
jgi:hypothetical protein